MWLIKISRTKTYLSPSEALAKEDIILFRKGYGGCYKLQKLRESQA